VKIQNAAAVAALLEAGADPNFANKKGVTAISAAAHKGNTEIMGSLIDAGSNVNACNSSGSTALIQVLLLDASHRLLSNIVGAPRADYQLRFSNM
jgi:ankyrin repeat protein